MNDQRCIHHRVETHAALTPDVIAIKCGRRSISYGDLNAAANRYARLLRERGVGLESVVALVGARSELAVVALLAILKAGAGYVPLDTDEPAPRARYVVSKSEVEVALVVGAVPPWLTGVTCIAVNSVDATSSDTDNEPARVDMSNVAAILYTSGSTGRPKGVVLTHRSVVLRFGGNYSIDEVPCQRAPLGVVGHVTDLLSPLASGRTVLMLDDGIVRDPIAFAETVRDEGVTFVNVVPSYMRVMLESPRAVAALSQVRSFVLSGEALSSAVLDQCQRRLPSARILNSYGMTETTGAVACADVTRSEPGQRSRLRPIAPIFVLDADRQPVPPGTMGEIYVGGDQLAREYWRLPELTKERFVPNPFGQAGDRLYRTGDLGSPGPDGTIQLGSRADGRLKVRGFLVDPAEVECVLEQHDAVRQAVIVGWDSASGGEQLAAFVVSTGAAAGTLRRHVGSALPDYMVPAAIRLVDGLPLNQAGKVDRQALRDAIGDGSEGARQSSAATRCQTSGDEASAHSAVVRAWQNVFPGANPDEDFFVLGGDSISAMRLLAGIETQCGIHIAMADLFEHSSLATLASFVGGRATASAGKAGSDATS